MSVHDEIEQMCSRIIHGENQTITRKIELYSVGVSAKIKNAKYALEMLEKLAPHSFTTSTSGSTTFSVLDQVHFYVDCFFAFTYSAFDVMAQVINQKLHINKNEWKVDISSMKNEINNHHSVHPLNSELNTLFNRIYFRNLKRYRNCSTHRRQIFIQERFSSRISTPGYTATSGDFKNVEKIICDNPLVLNPAINQNRELISYCNGVYDSMCRDIIQIAQLL